MDDILKEAIADAKALRATALENAKIALEEAFTPRLKSMLSQKIQSEDEEYSETEGEVGSGDGHMEAEDEHEVEERMHGEDEDDLEERMKDEDEEEVSEEMEDENEDEVSEEMEDENEDEVSEEMEDEGEHMEDEGEHMEDEEDELDLESVIRELEEELDSSDIGDAENKEPSERATDSSEVGAQGPEGEGADEEGGKENSEDEVVKEPVTEAEHDDKDEDEDIDLEEVIKALSEEEGMEDEEEEDKMDEMQTTLKEYKETIGYLREKLNEVNLMNAKLLFTNKLFRGFGLNNNQKLRVVEQFDRTKSLREIKLVYATLAESFKGNGNKRVNESKGQASKAVASTEPKKEVLSEGAEMKNRFKKLANLV